MDESRNRTADLGSFLASVEERDIDLLLLEEFHTNQTFVDWFSTRVAIDGAVFDGAWHSVANVDGETDLLVRVRAGGARVGILIENKIAAPEQKRQGERYLVRAERARREGKFEAFTTCMCAPQAYLDRLQENSLYQHRVSYESICDWFDMSEGSRNKWRSHVMREAILQSRRGYTMIINETTTHFFAAYWDYLRRHHPKLLMRRPSPKGSKSNWIVIKAAAFPRNVAITHKLDQRVMELGFQRRDVSDLLRAGSPWAKDIVPVQKGGTACLAVDVPAIDMRRDLTSQQDALEAALAAAYKLVPFANLLDNSIACGTVKVMNEHY